MKSTTFAKLAVIAVLASAYALGSGDPTCKSGDGKQTCGRCAICQADATSCKCISNQ